MLLKSFVNKVDNLKANLALYKFICLIAVIGMVYSVYVAHSSAINARTIILPPIVDQRIEISGIDASDSYYKLWTKYTMSLFFNYTPELFVDQGNDLVKLATPTYRDSLRIKIDEMAAQIEELQITSVFYPYDIDIDREKKSIYVDGARHQTANGIKIDDNRRTYVLKYIIDNGRFQIDGIHEKAEK